MVEAACPTRPPCCNTTHHTRNTTRRGKPCIGTGDGGVRQHTRGTTRGEPQVVTQDKVYSRVWLDWGSQSSLITLARLIKGVCLQGELYTGGRVAGAHSNEEREGRRLRCQDESQGSHRGNLWLISSCDGADRLQYKHLQSTITPLKEACTQWFSLINI